MAEWFKECTPLKGGIKKTQIDKSCIVIVCNKVSLIWHKRPNVTNRPVPFGHIQLHGQASNSQSRLELELDIYRQDKGEGETFR